jgi:hypothetical protein
VLELTGSGNGLSAVTDAADCAAIMVAADVCRLIDVQLVYGGSAPRHAGVFDHDLNHPSGQWFLTVRLILKKSCVAPQQCAYRPLHTWCPSESLYWLMRIQRAPFPTRMIAGTYTFRQ